MRLGESTAELRRFPIVLRDDDGALIEDDSALALLTTGDVKQSSNGTALADAPGTIGYSAESEYYYEATTDEAAVPGFLAVIVEATGVHGIAWEPVGDIFALGETNTNLLRWPLTIYDDSEPPALATGATASGAELQTNLNGSDFVTADGTLVELGLGLYYYQGVAADAADEGNRTIRYEKTGFQLAMTVIPVFATTTTGSTDTTPPVVTVVSPTPGVAPGDPGGFPADYATAKDTPIILQIVDAAVAYIAVFVRFGDAVRRTALFRRGAFESGFAGISTVEVVNATTMRLHCRGDAGWPQKRIRFTVDVVDAGGNVS